jgi:hypothetical protein
MRNSNRVSALQSMSESSTQTSSTAAACQRCARVLSAERPVRLPDNRVYCAACCESMAADVFEMETGEPFTRWIEKHPQLVMQYQPLELTVRRAGFFFPLALWVLGAAIFGYGIFTSIKSDVPVLYLLPGLIAPLLIAGLWVMYENFQDNLPVVTRSLMRIAAAVLAAAIPVYGLYGCLRFGKPFGFLVVGAAMIAFFAVLAVQGVQAYLRALNFRLILKEGIFHLQHGNRSDTFSADEVVQACVVRPGTVGATEGALRLQDGRMLTLDTCLSDLHALGVVMDLRFRADFPPSADDIARIRRDNLRKIRGLS